MKTRHLLLTAALMALSFCFAGCDNDHADDVDGLYSGTLYLSAAGQSLGSTETTVCLAETAPDKVTIYLPAITDINMPLPAIIVRDVTVKENKEDDYTLKETAINQTSADITFSGTIGGTVKNDLINLNYSLNAENPPMNVSFSFVGYELD